MRMKTIEEIRRENLLYLEEQYGTMANLNAAAGRSRRDSTLSQIKNQSINSSTRQARIMGSALAREIEKRINLSVGWMDQDHSTETNEEFKKVTNSTIIPNLLETDAMGSSTYKPRNKILTGALGLSNRFIDEVLKPTSRLNLRFITVDSDVNAPTFKSGDVLIIDVGITSYQRDAIYILESGNNLFIRRIVRKLDGAFELTQDNPAIRSSETLENFDKVKIIASVICVWNWNLL